MEKLHQVPETLEVAQFAGVDRPLQCALLLAVLLLELRQLERSRGDADLESILVPVRVVSQGFHLLDALERRDALLLQTNFDPVQHPLHRVETLEEGSDPLVERPEEATDEGQAFQKPPHPDRHRGLRPALLQVAAPTRAVAPEPFAVSFFPGWPKAASPPGGIYDDDGVFQTLSWSLIVRARWIARARFAR